MAVDVTSEVTKLRECIRAGKAQSERLKLRLQLPAAFTESPTHAEAERGRSMLNKILADVLKKPHYSEDEEQKAKDPTAVA